MDKETYYVELEKMLGRIKDLKKEINESDDKEKIKYLKLAINSINEEMRTLMDNYNKLNK